MTRRYLVALFQRLIKETQKSIGLVGYKLTPNKNGMVSMGDLMRQPRTFEIHFASNYNFHERRTRGMHIVITGADYKVIEYSPDPREGTQTTTFASPIDVARHCASVQINEATNNSLSRDKEFKELNPKESFEQLKRYSELIQQHQQIVKEKLERYLRSKKARLINWLIKVLSKSA